MGRTDKFDPQVFIPAIKVPQPGGAVLVRPGTPIVDEDVCDLAEACRILKLSRRTLSYQCEIGLLKTAYKPGGRPRSKWMVSRSEVYARKQLQA